MHELIKKLVEIQEAEALSDRGFAAKLGLSNGQWSAVKAGNNNMGRKTLRAILAWYPGLRPHVDSYWLAQLTTSTAVNNAIAAKG